MNAHVIDRADGRVDGDEWSEDHTELPGGAEVSIMLESTRHAGRGPRLHMHPYAETFVIRRGSATFTVGMDADRREVEAHAGQILIVPADTPHKFVTGPDGYEGVHIHAATSFETIWLE